MGVTHLACGCGRKIPALGLWKALWQKVPLKCAKCESLFTDADLRHLVEVDEYTRAIYAVYTQILRYGWTSADALRNAGASENALLLGAVLTHLQQAGLIQKREGPEPREGPVFVRGPRCPSGRLAKPEDPPR